MTNNIPPKLCRMKTILIRDGILILFIIFIRGGFRVGVGGIFSPVIYSEILLFS